MKIFVISTIKIDVSLIKSYFASVKSEVTYLEIFEPAELFNFIEKNIKDSENKALIISDYGVKEFLITSKIKKIIPSTILDEYTAQLTPLHNDARVAIFGAKILAMDYIVILIKIFLKTHFEGGRHMERINMVNEI